MTSDASTDAKELESQVSDAPSLHLPGSTSESKDPEHPLALLSPARKNLLLLIFSISGFVDGTCRLRHA